jgi:3'-5' exoribonuclease
VPASVSRHHAYDGGLVVHVNEVWQFASALARHSGANIHILLAATIYHDLMKIRELVKDGLTWKHTDYKDKIFHVAGSFAVWEVQCTLRGIDKDFKDQVSHCLLSHHGRIEWGAAREPQTKEAYILHVADMISYQFGAGAR